RTLVPEYREFGAKLAQGSTPHNLYLVHRHGVDNIRSGMTSRRISETDEQIGIYKFNSIGRAALDQDHNRLLVGDSGLNMILGIDLETGIREAVVAPGVGEGNPLIFPTSLAV